MLPFGNGWPVAGSMGATPPEKSPARIAAVGRMALTNYLLHSLVFTTLVNSYGMGTYGRVHPLQGFYYCCAFYALQIPFSMLWLKYFQFGPAEWVWRSLTYGVRQPWLKAAA